jgi:hypothetical protein
MEAEGTLTIDEKRRLIGALLSQTDPGDALTSYYALCHDPLRTQLTLHQTSLGRVDGFLTISQTGFDLFRPLVTLRAADQAVAAELVHASLADQRPYQIIVPEGLASDLAQDLEFTKPSVNRVFEVKPGNFRPVINVLVQRASRPDGGASFRIESRGQLVAMSGTNWRSPSFAEVFVYVDEANRGRGWGRSVVSACTAALLEARLRPLYMVSEENPASRHIAQALGYTDSGSRELEAECRLARLP